MDRSRERVYESLEGEGGERKRTVIRRINPARARTAIGPVRKGCELFGVSKGQFSLAEILEHCLLEAGPSDLLISTWTTGAADLVHLGILMDEDLILNARWLIDSSFPERQPSYCRALLKRFGPGSVTCTANHAKFCVITNPDWNLCIRTSMNLNLNRRLETYEISDDPVMARFLLELAEAAFRDGYSVEQTKLNSDRAYRSVNKIMGECKVPDRTVYTTPRAAKGQLSYSLNHSKLRPQ